MLSFVLLLLCVGGVGVCSVVHTCGVRVCVKVVDMGVVGVCVGVCDVYRRCRWRCCRV